MRPAGVSVRVRAWGAWLPGNRGVPATCGCTCVCVCVYMSETVCTRNWREATTSGVCTLRSQQPGRLGCRHKLPDKQRLSTAMGAGPGCTYVYIFIYVCVYICVHILTSKPPPCSAREGSRMELLMLSVFV